MVASPRIFALGAFAALLLAMTAVLIRRGARDPVGPAPERGTVSPAEPLVDAALAPPAALPAPPRLATPSPAKVEDPYPASVGERVRPVTVRVARASGGAPIAAANVRLRGLEAEIREIVEAEILVAQTDEYGRFTYSHGERLIALRAAKGPVLVVVTADGFLGVTRPISADELAGLEEIQVVLARRLEIRGLVVDRRGDPVEGATVRLCEVDDPGTTWSSRTGAFELETASAAPVVVSVRHPERGAAEVRIEARVVADDGSVDLARVVLEERGSIGGVAVYPDGRPAPRLWLVAERLSRAESSGVGVPCGGAATAGGIQVRTEETGAFRFADLDAGEYTLRASIEEPPVREALPHFRVGTSDARIVVRSRIVAVRLVDPQGRPVHPATWSCDHLDEAGKLVRNSAGRTTAPDAPILIHPDRPGVIRLSVSADAVEVRGSDIPVSATTWSSEITLVLAPIAARGSVTLSLTGGDGTPIRDFYAVLRRRDAAEESLIDRGWIDSRNGAESSPLVPGEYVVDVLPGLTKPLVPHAPGQEYAWARRIVDVAAGRSTPLRVVAERGGRIAATAEFPIDWTGSARVRTRVRAADGFTFLGGWQSTIGAAVGHLSDRQRRLFAPPLPPGRYVVEAEVEGGRAMRFDVEVRPGETSDLRIPIEKK